MGYFTVPGIMVPPMSPCSRCGTTAVLYNLDNLCFSCIVDDSVVDELSREDAEEIARVAWQREGF
jgi:NMD protein affecting ribosome stability and mRNA decay